MWYSSTSTYSTLHQALKRLFAGQSLSAWILTGRIALFPNQNEIPHSLQIGHIQRREPDRLSAQPFDCLAGIDEFVKGDYLKRAYAYAAANWQPWIGLMSLITMPNLDWTNDGNPQDEEQYWWAIMEPSPIQELNFRAAYIILCAYFNELEGQFCKYDPARQ